MAFSAVSWAYRDVVSSTKLQQMVDNLKAHDHRSDGSQGSAFKRVGSFSIPSIAAGGNTTVDVTFPTAFPTGVTPTVALVSNSSRHNLSIAAVSNTGFTVSLNNWTGANASAGTGYYVAMV